MNIFASIGRGLLRVTALDAVGRAAGAGARDLGRSRDRLRDLRRMSAKVASQGHLVPANAGDDAARFELLIARMGLHESEIARRADGAANTVLVVAICIFALLAFCLLARSAWGLIALPYLLAEGFRASLAHYQLTRRRLIGARAFLARPGDWWPLPPPGGTTAALLAFLVLSLPSLAMAQGITLPDPTTTGTDMAGRILGALLPGNPSAIIGSPNPLAAAIGVLSRTLLMVGAAVITWHTISGVVFAAHTGKAMQDRYHLLWSPIRVVLGFALLAPIPGGNGLSAGHLGVALIARTGNDIASRVWVTFVQHVAAGSPDGAATSTLGLPQSVGGLEITRRVLIAETCQASLGLRYAAYQRGMAFDRWSGTAAIRLPELTGRTTDAGRTVLWDYGRCGAISVPINTGASVQQGFDAARLDALRELMMAVRQSAVPEELAKAQIPNGGDWPRNIVDRLRTASGNYEAAMRAAGTAFVGERDRALRGRLVEDAKAQGWPSAGAYWRTLSTMSAQVIQAASVMPEIENPRLSGGWLASRGMEQQGVADALARLGEQWAEETRIPRLSGTDLSAPGDDSSDFLTRVLAPVARPMQQGILDLFAASSTGADPVRASMTFGHTLLVAGGAAIVAGLAIAAATGNIISSSVGAAAAWSWASGWAMPLIAVIMACGFAHAYVLPLLPYISVLWLFIRWCLLLLECLVAIPIFAFMLMRMDGDELVGQVHRAGILILFNLALMPVLGVIGVAGSYYILPMVLAFLGSTFGPAFIGAQGGHLVGLVGMVGGLVLYTWLDWQVCVRVLAFVHEVPDHVSRWFGASPEGHDDKQIHNRAVAVAGGGAAHAARATTGGIKPGASKPSPSAKPQPPAGPATATLTVGGSE